ncbi:hypothetical protein DPX16_10803 [Anabarilius grahami]|uniref:Uncharacterized protein n=1 Tax=Anabarilius grahami TaxID=495550 RepID=A0A3N0Z7F6_ANAGA|nr:hypothetical protein DPX16_10803 [Anabarilius grahami]
MSLWLEDSALVVSSPALLRWPEQHCNNPAVPSKHETSQPTNRASPMWNRTELRPRSAWKMLSAVQGTGMRVVSEASSLSMMVSTNGKANIDGQLWLVGEK